MAASPHIAEIQRAVGLHFGTKMIDMVSARRSRCVARPRQVAMYLARQMTTLSLPQIGRHFGNRDHTTVMHACRKIEELRALDAAFSATIDSIEKEIASA